MKTNMTGEGKFILFLLSPFLALIASLKSLNTKSSRFVLFFFILFFGFSMIYDGSLRNDGIFHAVEFQNYGRHSFECFERQIASFFDFDNPENVKDIYALTVKFIVSRFTDNYHYFFLAISILYAFFTVKYFRYFADLKQFVWTIPWVILLYIFWKPQPVDINGVRFGTASLITIYSLFKVFVSKQNKYLFLICTTPLIHASFIFVFGLLAIIYLTRKYEKFWVLLLFLSFVFSELSLQLLKDNAHLLQSSFWASWVNDYANFDELYGGGEGSGFYWLTPIFNILSRSFMLGMVIINIKNKIIVKSDVRTNELYMVSIIWYTISNFSYAIPSLGARFITISFPLIAYIWAVHFKNTKYIKYLYLFPVCNLVQLKEQLGIYMSLLEPTFFLSPLVNFVKYTTEYIPASIPSHFF